MKTFHIYNNIWLVQLLYKKQTHTMNTFYLVNAQTATCFGLFLGHHQACITILK